MAKRNVNLSGSHPRRPVSPEVLADSVRRMSGPDPVIRWIHAIESATGIFASAKSLPPEVTK